MAERKEKITYLSPEELIPYEYNAREHNTEIEFLKNSISEFGFRNPILIDANNVIIAGHGRRIAAMELGMKRVPCIICEDLTEEQVKALRLVDNKSSDLGSYDWDILNKELAELKDLGWDMERFAFEDMAQFNSIDIEGDDEEEEELLTETIDSSPKGGERTYRIMVICDDESTQNDVLEMLNEKGIRCQIMD